MKAILKKVLKVNENVKSFYFEPEQDVKYTAGQFIELIIPHKNTDDRGEKRWFTLSSSPNDGLLRITTKFADPSSSFKTALSSLKVGSVVDMIEPMGDFVLPKATNIPLVFVAGGMGITPFASMVSWLSQERENRKIQVILAVTHKEDLLFEKLFEDYGAEIIKVVSEPDAKWHGEIGHLNGARVDSLVGGLENKRIYVSGPEPMVEALEKDLLKIGVDKTQLVLDFFPGYPVV